MAANFATRGVITLLDASNFVNTPIFAYSAKFCLGTMGMCVSNPVISFIYSLFVFTENLDYLLEHLAPELEDQLKRENALDDEK